MGKTEAVAEGSGPGSCEDAMMKAGGIFKDGGVFGENVVVSGNLMTGQNPPSAGPLATAVIYFYDKILAEFEPPRKALLAERAELAAAVMKTKADFEGELTALKKKEGTVDVAAKIETLQLKTTAGHEYLMGCIANIDGALERLAIARKAAVDAAAAAAAADAEE
jgi:malate synthase